MSNHITVREMRPGDVEGVAEAFASIIDELYSGDENVPARRRITSQYQPSDLAAMVENADSYSYVAKSGAKLAGFLFGVASCRAGHLHWLGVAREYRKLGAGAALVRRCMRDFARCGAFQVDTFTPPGRALTGFFRQFGFERRALLERTMLGSPSQYLVAPLREATEDEMTRRIIVVGDAGQGIRLLGHVLASILADLGKEVSLNITKPSSVRGGTIAAELCFSEAPIRSPFFVDADILVQLAPGSPPHTVRAKRVIIDETIQHIELSSLIQRTRGQESEVYDFVRQAREDLGNPVFTNMIVLGNILGHMGMDVDKLNLPEEIPARFLEQNIRAIQKGFSIDLPQAY
ncbi:MAG: GNAT family N-acetyltransferase [candidate division WS1 bacterium]|jgi:Pyruvate/2-oxoacid:ferredoxin oxidoreductase gamma subunit|nr:GNAT family N-acetyltransferase [candidate division WS1 bacterium]